MYNRERYLELVFTYKQISLLDEKEFAARYAVIFDELFEQAQYLGALNRQGPFGKKLNKQSTDRY